MFHTKMSIYLQMKYFDKRHICIRISFIYILDINCFKVFIQNK